MDRAHGQTAGFSPLKVSHAIGKPILFLPAEPERSDLPMGRTEVFIDGEAYSANFVKVAVNVVRRSGDEDNQLPSILRRWFGPDAGAPGTRHVVALEHNGAPNRLSFRIPLAAPGVEQVIQLDQDCND